MDGFARVSVAIPPCRVAGADENVARIAELAQRAHAAESAVVAFPELAISSYTARDLFFDGQLLDTCERALAQLVEKTRDLSPLFIVGLPVRQGGKLFNAAAVFQGGRVLGVVPKSYLPNYREFEERRWFRPGTEVPPGDRLSLGGASVPFGTDLLFVADGVRDLVVGVEICEDFWVHVPPSAFQVSAGATVCVNLSASNFTVGKADLRRLLARSMSDRGKCAYLYVAAGPGESSTDLAFDADGFITENGAVLAESQRFDTDPQLVTADVDLASLVHERMVTGSFGDCAAAHARPVRKILFRARESRGLMRAVKRHPFLPDDDKALATRCWEIYEIQTHALLTRMNAIGRPRLVLGLSGGLDSTQAALVAAGALDLAGRPRDALLCVTMPGFGTSDTTRDNATKLAESLGAELRTVSIAEASKLLLSMIGHPSAEGAASVQDLVDTLRARPETADATVQNVQARLRTLVLMSLANQEGGVVVGTGDLSEKALGWSTYAGDHIAMYDVNAGVPKTLIQFVIRWVIDARISTWVDGDKARLAETLRGVVDTPISPELLPLDERGEIAHRTEDELGPYELHDFFLFHFVRHGARPARVLDLARVAFGDAYDLDTLKRWLRVFVQRFFSQQFKRSCTADGPKVGMVALSPRGDWRMPSDADASAWLAAIDAYAPRAT